MNVTKMSLSLGVDAIKSNFFVSIVTKSGVGYAKTEV